MIVTNNLANSPNTIDRSHRQRREFKYDPEKGVKVFDFAWSHKSFQDDKLTAKPKQSKVNAPTRKLEACERINRRIADGVKSDAQIVSDKIERSIKRAAQRKANRVKYSYK